MYNNCITAFKIVQQKQYNNPKNLYSIKTLPVPPALTKDMKNVKKYFKYIHNYMEN